MVLFVMLEKFFSKLFDVNNQKYLKSMCFLLPKIQNQYLLLKEKSDQELLELSSYLKTKYQSDFQEKTFNKNYKEEKLIEISEKILADILPQAFALVKEVTRRELGIELYDVQLIGGAILHFGNVAEMKTGEGKTYTALLPAYLNSLSGKQVHVVTMNDYLSKRDAEKVRPILARLGVKVGCNSLSSDESHLKPFVYLADIVYGTSTDFGFDFLRDGAALEPSEVLIKERYFAIVDEIDSVLIDEARTPLIISKNKEEDETEALYLCHQVVKNIRAEFFEPKDSSDESDLDAIINLKNKALTFTEKGMERVDELSRAIGLISKDESVFINNLHLMTLMQKAAEAQFLYFRDKDYLIKENSVQLIDSNTGRIMDGRQLSDGLHQAIEVKEDVKLSQVTETFATTTLQHYFNGYQKLSGMSGTVMTDANEFESIYQLKCIPVPTNRPNIRIDHQDKIYVTRKAKDEKFISMVKEQMEHGRPILIGTSSVKENERYSRLLLQRGILHEVINAKNHEREADIIKKAGRPHAITLATNMAGRGTDIILGGEIEGELEALTNNLLLSNGRRDVLIKKLVNRKEQDYKDINSKGGLFLLGLSKGDNRRIDNQLRGRSGRQGDCGESVFLLSLEDEVYKPFGIDKKTEFIKSTVKDDSYDIGSRMTRGILNTMQQKIEDLHFEIRKSTIDFNKTTDEQSDFYQEIRKVYLNSTDEEMREKVKEIAKDAIKSIFDRAIPSDLYEECDLSVLEEINNENFTLDIGLLEKELDLSNNIQEVSLKWKGILFEQFEERLKEIDRKKLREIVLRTMDRNWIYQLNQLQEFRDSVGLQGYAGKDPKEIYKKWAFDSFFRLLKQNDEDIILKIMSYSVQ